MQVQFDIFSAEKEIPANDSVRLIEQIVEEIDIVKQNYAFRQFLLRGKKKVFTEILLVAMAYNVNKLHAKIQQNRTGTQLFKKLSA